MPSPDYPQELLASTVDYSEAATTQKKMKKKRMRKQVEDGQSPRSPTSQMDDPTETGTMSATEGSLTCNPLTPPKRHVKKKANLKNSPVVHRILSDDAFRDEPASSLSTGARSGTGGQLQPKTSSKRKKKKKQQRQGEDNHVHLVPVEKPLHESFRILGLAASESTKPTSMAQKHNHSDSLLHASDRNTKGHNDKEKSRSKGTFTSLKEAMNPSRRDHMVQHKQRRKVPPPLLHPRKYSMAPRLQSAAMALSAGAGMARDAQMCKDHKQQEKEIPANSISATTFGRSGESTKTSKGEKPLPRIGDNPTGTGPSNIQWKPPEAFIRMKHPPSAPPSPAQTEQKLWRCWDFFSRHNSHGVLRRYRREFPVYSRERRLDVWTPQFVKRGRVALSFGQRKESR